MSLRRRKLKCLSRATNIDKGYLCTSGAGSAYPSGSPDFTPCFSGIRFTRSLVLCVCFVDRCLSFCPFSIGHNVVCPAIYVSDFPNSSY